MKNTLITQLFTIWKSMQTDLAKVIRWKGYLRKGRKMRRQNTLAHTQSVTFVVSAVLIKLKKHNPGLDEALLLRAFNIHDFSEGVLQKDVLAHQKKDHHDLAEYEAFMEYFQDLDEDIFREMQRAFLLQFAEKNPEIFPKEAREIMNDLWETKRQEALLFPALESFEYIYYAYEADEDGTHDHLLTWVFRNQLRKQTQYCDQILGYREEVFTSSLENRICVYLEDHAHVPYQ